MLNNEGYEEGIYEQVGVTEVRIVLLWIQKNTFF